MALLTSLTLCAVQGKHDCGIARRDDGGHILDHRAIESRCASKYCLDTFDPIRRSTDHHPPHTILEALAETLSKFLDAEIPVVGIGVAFGANEFLAVASVKTFASSSHTGEAISSKGIKLPHWLGVAAKTHSTCLGQRFLVLKDFQKAHVQI